MKFFKYLMSALVLLQCGVVHADRVGMPKPMLKSYEVECGSCHTVYAPVLLPAENWHVLLTNLEHHYGADATLDVSATKEIDDWLRVHAATRGAFSEMAPENRITKTNWFMRKHRGIAESVWQRVSIKSRSNCSACHAQASKGDFEDDRVKVPK